MRIDETMWGLTATANLQTKLRALREGRTDDWTIDEFEHYLRFYKRSGEKTAKNYRRQLDFMARHPIAPVNLHGTRADLIESFSMYATAREQIEGTSAGALKTDHQAVRALGAFLSIPENVWPTAPRPARMEAEWIPSPEQIYDLLHADFGPRGSYQHFLVRHMLAYSYGFGVRPCGEILSARVSDVDLDHNILVVEEMKKGGSTLGKKRRGMRRQLVVSPEWLLQSRKRLSVRLWIEGPRKLCKPQCDDLFPNLDGQPFRTTEQCAQFLKRAVRAEIREKSPDTGKDIARATRFEWYHPYGARHWSVNARAIQSGRVIDGQKVYDWNATARWHGHESVKMTMNEYGRSVEVNEAKYGRDWLARAFGARGPNKTDP